MKRLFPPLLCLLLLLSACVPGAEVTPTPEPSPQVSPSEAPSSILYVNRELNLTMEMPLSWLGRVVIDDNCTTDDRNGGQYVTVYQKATYEQGLDGPDGELFSIGRYPGHWTEDEPPVYAGGCVLVMEAEGFTYFAITPSDVHWVESDAEIQADYADLVSQFSFVWSHIGTM